MKVSGALFLAITKRTYLEQNAAASALELSEDELRRLDEDFPAGAAAGPRYADMSSIGR